jgi:uncharacterized protein (DUF305 family)
MAKFLVDAKHPELKKMGLEIITAQQKEIDQMNAWLKAWGYITTKFSSTGSTTDMMQGGMMNM